MMNFPRRQQPPLPPPQNVRPQAPSLLSAIMSLNYSGHHASNSRSCWSRPGQKLLKGNAIICPTESQNLNASLWTWIRHQALRQHPVISAFYEESSLKILRTIGRPCKHESVIWSDSSLPLEAMFSNFKAELQKNFAQQTDVLLREKAKVIAELTDAVQRQILFKILPCTRILKPTGKGGNTRRVNIACLLSLSKRLASGQTPVFQETLFRRTERQFCAQLGAATLPNDLNRDGFNKDAPKQARNWSEVIWALSCIRAISVGFLPVVLNADFHGNENARQIHELSAGVLGLGGWRILTAEATRFIDTTSWMKMESFVALEKCLQKQIDNMDLDVHSHTVLNVLSHDLVPSTGTSIFFAPTGLKWRVSETAPSNDPEWSNCPAVLKDALILKGNQICGTDCCEILFTKHELDKLNGKTNVVAKNLTHGCWIADKSNDCFYLLEAESWCGTWKIDVPDSNSNLITLTLQNLRHQDGAWSAWYRIINGLSQALEYEKEVTVGCSVDLAIDHAVREIPYNAVVTLVHAGSKVDVHMAPIGSLHAPHLGGDEFYKDKNLSTDLESLERYKFGELNDTRIRPGMKIMCLYWCFKLQQPVGEQIQDEKLKLLFDSVAGDSGLKESAFLGSLQEQMTARAIHGKVRIKAGDWISLAEGRFVEATSNVVQYKIDFQLEVLGGWFENHLRLCRQILCSSPGDKSVADSEVPSRKAKIPRTCIGQHECLLPECERADKNHVQFQATIDSDSTWIPILQILDPKQIAFKLQGAYAKTANDSANLHVSPSTSKVPQAKAACRQGASTRSQSSGNLEELCLQTEAAVWKLAGLRALEWEQVAVEACKNLRVIQCKPLEAAIKQGKTKFTVLELHKHFFGDKESSKISKDQFRQKSLYGKFMKWRSENNELLYFRPKTPIGIPDGHVDLNGIRLFHLIELWRMVDFGFVENGLVQALLASFFFPRPGGLIQCLDTKLLWFVPLLLVQSIMEGHGEALSSMHGSQEPVQNIEGMCFEKNQGTLKTPSSSQWAPWDALGEKTFKDIFCNKTGAILYLTINFQDQHFYVLHVSIARNETHDRAEIGMEFRDGLSLVPLIARLRAIDRALQWILRHVSDDDDAKSNPVREAAATFVSKTVWKRCKIIDASVTTELVTYGVHIQALDRSDTKTLSTVDHFPLTCEVSEYNGHVSANSYFIWTSGHAGTKRCFYVPQVTILSPDCPRQIGVDCGFHITTLVQGSLEGYIKTKQLCLSDEISSQFKTITRRDCKETIGKLILQQQDSTSLPAESLEKDKFTSMVHLITDQDVFGSIVHQFLTDPKTFLKEHDECGVLVTTDPSWLLCNNTGNHEVAMGDKSAHAEVYFVVCKFIGCDMPQPSFQIPAIVCKCTPIKGGTTTFVFPADMQLVIVPAGYFDPLYSAYIAPDDISKHHSDDTCFAISNATFEQYLKKLNQEGGSSGEALKQKKSATPFWKSIVDDSRHGQILVESKLIHTVRFQDCITKSLFIAYDDAMRERILQSVVPTSLPPSLLLTTAENFFIPQVELMFMRYLSQNHFGAETADDYGLSPTLRRLFARFLCEWTNRTIILVILGTSAGFVSGRDQLQSSEAFGYWTCEHKKIEDCVFLILHHADNVKAWTAQTFWKPKQNVWRSYTFVHFIDLPDELKKLVSFDNAEGKLQIQNVGQDNPNPSRAHHNEQSCSGEDKSSGGAIPDGTLYYESVTDDTKLHDPKPSSDLNRAQCIEKQIAHSLSATSQTTIANVCVIQIQNRTKTKLLHPASSMTYPKGAGGGNPDGGPRQKPDGGELRVCVCVRVRARACVRVYVIHMHEHMHMFHMYVHMSHTQIAATTMATRVRP